MEWLWVVLILFSFVFGIYFVKIVNFIIKFIRKGFDGVIKGKASEIGIARTSKVIASLSVLTTISIIVWLIGYYLKQNNPSSIWTDVASAIFGVCTAALLGGIVFELLLRRELTAEVTGTLAKIITLDKQIAEDIYTHERRNQIIKTMLQINTGNDLYGEAIYSDFISRFIDPETNQFREFRSNFSDDIKYDNISPEHNDLSDKFYYVRERLRYKAELRPSNFTIACASNESQLYDLFSDPTCIYRWLLKADNFEYLMTQRQGFRASLSVDGISCNLLNESGTITSRGYEICFQNPFITPNASKEYRSKVGEFVEFEINAHTFHDRNDRVVSIHLVYPVKGVEIKFDYKDTDINDVIALHFLSPGQKKSRGGGVITGTSIAPIFAPNDKKLIVPIPDNTWLFPDSGIIIVW